MARYPLLGPALFSSAKATAATSGVNVYTVMAEALLGFKKGHVRMLMHRRNVAAPEMHTILTVTDIRC